MTWNVSAPSRLHFGLIDLTGDHGRIDGGAGIALAYPRVVVRAKKGTGVLDLPENLRALAIGLADRLHVDLGGIDISLVERFRAHVGLGSHTQLALALGTAITRAATADHDTQAIALAASRGGTSGIGVNVFDSGGLIVDGGHSFGPGLEKEVCLPSSASRAGPAPMLARYELPEEWRFALVTPKTEPGAHGSREVNLFEEAFPLPVEDTGSVCRLVLMGLMPGAASANLELLGRSLSSLQEVGFKRREVSLQPAPIIELGPVMLDAGAVGAGLTSFGPTVYALAGNEGRAQAVVNAALAHLAHHGIDADGWVTPPDNRGAVVTQNDEE